MGKGLEALGKLTGTQNLTMYEQNECLKIIEEELKRIEELENCCIKAGITIDDYFKYLIEETIDNDKKLKAFEIIKEMVDSDIGNKLNANSRKILKEIFESLPKEKQDLLKKVLLK